MKVKDILALMYEAEEEQLVCIQDHNETVYYLGTVADLRRIGKPDETEVITMYTERIRSHGGKSCLTIVIA